MWPTLVQIGPFTLSTYGAMTALAFVLVVGMVRHATRRTLRGLVPMSDEALVDWAVWAVLGGILGGRLLYVLLNWEVYAARPQEILAIWHGGLVWYGGFTGGMLTTMFFFRRRRIPPLEGLDQVIPFGVLGHAVGRLGCFANGCCYGKFTTSWFGVRFPGHALPTVPTQLFESAGLVVLYLGLRALQRPVALNRPGTVFAAYLIGYGILRGMIEQWRANQPIVWGVMTVSQCISLILIVLGAFLLTKHHEEV